MAFKARQTTPSSKEHVLHMDREGSDKTLCGLPKAKVHRIVGVKEAHKEYVCRRCQNIYIGGMF